MREPTPILLTIWTPPSRVPGVVLPPSSLPVIQLPGGGVGNDVVTIDLLSDGPATTERFRMVGFKWEPGDDEVTYIDEEL